MYEVRKVQRQCRGSQGKEDVSKIDGKKKRGDEPEGRANRSGKRKGDNAVVKSM